MRKVSTDIYDITETVLDVQKNYIEEETEETLTTGTYGYLADILSRNLQNSIIVTSELGNELFPYKSKFEDNIIAHAIIQNITDINAVPATMSIVFGIKESDLNELMIGDRFVVDKDSVINFDEFEFHLQYDLIIDKLALPNNEYTYTARYDMSVKNNISEITNPYIPIPFVQYVNTVKYIFFSVDVMQVSHEVIPRKITSSSVIENRTFEFEIAEEDQLADFMVYVENQDGTSKYLTPLFEGVGVENNLVDYCFYFFVNANKIRVTFDSLSYLPQANSDVTVYLKTTKGEAGNFEFNEQFLTNISSEKYNYKYMTILVIPASNSEYGRDKKSIDELRRLIPKEALSRGSIINMQDVENFFNMINIDFRDFVPYLIKSLPPRIQFREEIFYTAFFIIHIRKFLPVDPVILHKKFKAAHLLHTQSIRKTFNAVVSRRGATPIVNFVFNFAYSCGIIKIILKERDIHIANFFSAEHKHRTDIRHLGYP